MAKVTKWFDSSELACKCGQPGCLKMPMLKNEQLLFLDKMTTLRENLGRPLVTTSYYRCPKHSLWKEGNCHCEGLAMDVYSPTIDLIGIWLSAEKIGFNGMGFNIHKGFVHLDMGRRLIRYYYNPDDSIVKTFYKEIV